ncbi:hypothetical protein FYJ86_07185 [Corynebacterium urealyticum]|uniref:hypothetical protein n=1 Tax=Corynebacterium urealyticum TaxID=43771 RepID=UPI0011E84D1D|nr:hypothetical protein [Corynebacterium urealyticum]TYR17633.1 hypothetical protein FYJ88_01945 [Corynebacterium urealyticum]TYT20513.1 hypothetical protein FYJ86_07185 [Corynebacterium urealyticum]
MNVDMITTFLNDFSTFWKNIWEFLKPIFNMANPEGWTKLKDLEGEDRKQAHLDNLNNLAKAFGKKPEVGEGYTPVEPKGSSK